MWNLLEWPQYWLIFNTPVCCMWSGSTACPFMMPALKMWLNRLCPVQFPLLEAAVTRNMLFRTTHCSMTETAEQILGKLGKNCGLSSPSWNVFALIAGLKGFELILEKGLYYDCERLHSCRFHIDLLSFEVLKIELFLFVTSRKSQFAPSRKSRGRKTPQP